MFKAKSNSLVFQTTIIYLLCFTAVLGLYSNNSEAVVTGEMDYIFHGANIITIDELNPIADAIAIQAEAIVAVGADEEILEIYHTENPSNTIDLNGLTIMPGFVDGHTHLLFSTVWTGLIDLTAAQDIALSYGYTTIVEKSAWEWDLEPVLAADQAGDLRLRVNMFPSYNSAHLNEQGETIICETWYPDRSPILTHDAMLRVPGIKIFTDGAGVPGRGAPAMSWPYPPELMEGEYESVTDNEYGDLYLEQQELNIAAKNIQDAGFRVAFHACGDRAIETVMNATEFALDGESNSVHRHQIEHGFLRPDLITRAKQLGTLHSVRGYFPTYWQEWYEDMINETIQWKMNRYSLPEEGIHAYWESDFSWNNYGDNSTSANINPFLHLWGYVTRSAIDENGTIHRPRHWVAEHEISVEQALRMMTIDAAYIVSQEDYIGTLESGKFADLIVLSDSPLDVHADELKDLEVYLTMVGGKIEFVKDGSGLEELLPPPPSSLLIPTLVVIAVIPFAALVVFKVIRKNRP
ncbi:MAG: amidohydrolase [Candidatus Thorarchaeota archaeon]